MNPNEYLLEVAIKSNELGKQGYTVVGVINPTSATQDPIPVLVILFTKTG